MQITENINLRVQVADIETLRCLYTAGFYNPDKDEWKIFEISEYKNDLYEFVSFYNINNFDRGVWYNGVSFDCQIIQYILDNYSQWSDFTNQMIIDKIYNYAQKVIEDKNYRGFGDYRESQFDVPCFDVFTILGLDNEARRTSLKKCEYQLDLDSVEEMPIHHNVEKLSKEEIQQVISYMKNDILATYEVFKLVLGDTNHSLYKGNNQLDLRFSIKEEFGLDCLNYSDIKIGDELLKKSYAEAKKIELKDVPKKGYFRKEIILNKAIPKYVQFKSPELKNILKETKTKIIAQTDKHEVQFKYKGTKYTIGLGGGHSDNSSQVWESDKDNQIVDLDVGSLYPAIIVNNQYFPQHLGKELLKVYKELYEKRIELKPLSKKDKKIAGIVGAIKLILNSAYGKMGSMDSWMYDKQVQVNVCLTGQFALLMLIEELELNGIHVFMFNTDGITLVLNKSKKEIFETICKQWEQKTQFVLERVDYKKMYFSTVNDYLAITSDDKVKVKGDLISDFELWKNKSWRVVGLALQEYFVNGKDPIQFIKNHNNIYDFCIMARASGQLYLEMQKIIKEGEYNPNWKQQLEQEWFECMSGYWAKKEWLEQDIDYYKVCLTYEEAVKICKKLPSQVEIQKLKKLLRYYLTTDKEWQLFKRGIGSTGKNANIGLHADNELGSIYIKYFNQYEQKSMKDYNIDYNQYIYKALKLIDKIEGTKKLKSFIENQKPTKQISLF